MNKNNVIELERRAISADPLTELLKEGARKLLAEAVESEVQELLAKYQDWRTESGHAGVVRNGYLPERELQTGLGPIRVRIPKVRSKTGEAVSFQSVLVPPYVRKTATFEAAIPWLYLKGVSSGEMAEALRVLVGPQAQGSVGQHGIPPETGMGGGISSVEPASPGTGPVGVCLG